MVKKVVKFLKILDNKLFNIKQFPLSSPKLEETKDIHYCVINKQINLYYRIYELEIEVITLFDNRGNSNTLKIK